MIFVKEEYLNATEGYWCGDSGVQESRFEDDEVGKLFKSCQKEFGKCAGKVYVEKNGGRSAHVGWLFQKACRYTDTGQKYILEVWITMHTKEPKKKTKYFYKEVKSK